MASILGVPLIHQIMPDQHGVEADFSDECPLDYNEALENRSYTSH